MKTPLKLLGWLVCLGAGYLGGGYLARPGTSPVAVAASATLRTANTSGSPADRVCAGLASPQRARWLLEASVAHPGDLSRIIAACLHDTEALQCVVSIWFEKDPNALVRVMAPMLDLYQGGSQYMILQNAVYAWAQRDADAAWKAVDGLGDIRVKEPLITQLLSDRLYKNPESALREYAKRPELYLAGSLAKEHRTPDLLPLIAPLPDTVGKASLMADCMSSMPLKDAMNQLSGGTGFANFRTSETLLNAAGKKDLDSVIDFHRTATGSAKVQAASVIGRELVKTDPAAAVKWAEANLSATFRVQVLEKAADELAKTDPAAAEAARLLLPSAFRSHPK